MERFMYPVLLTLGVSARLLLVTTPAFSQAVSPVQPRNQPSPQASPQTGRATHANTIFEERPGQMTPPQSRAPGELTAPSEDGVSRLLEEDCQWTNGGVAHCVVYDCDDAEICIEYGNYCVDHYGTTIPCL